MAEDMNLSDHHPHPKLRILLAVAITSRLLFVVAIFYSADLISQRNQAIGREHEIIKALEKVIEKQSTIQDRLDAAN